MNAISEKAGRLSDEFVDESRLSDTLWANYKGSGETVYNECGLKSIEFSQAPSEVNRGLRHNEFERLFEVSHWVCQTDHAAQRL
jgi:hypothetical protein